MSCSMMRKSALTPFSLARIKKSVKSRQFNWDFTLFFYNGYCITAGCIFLFNVSPGLLFHR